MKTKKRLTWKHRLRPLAELIEQAQEMLHQSSDDHLRKLLAASEKPTQVNCGWSTYHASIIFRPLILSQMAERRYRKLRAKQAKEGK